MNYPYIGWKVVVQLWIKGLYENIRSCISLKLAVLSYSTNLFQLIVYNPMEKKNSNKNGLQKVRGDMKNQQILFFFAVAYISFVYVKYIHMS
jgi:hypothetical protein